MKVIIIVASLAVIIAIVICGVPLVAVPYTVDIYHEDVETYYEKEPYNVSIPIDYRVTEASIYNWFWHTGSDVWVTIQNTDTKSGYFEVTFDLVTRGGARITKVGREYIAITETKRVQVKHAGDNIKTFTYSVVAPNKEITQYRDVKKERTVTRVRQETRYENVTVLEYLIDYL